MVYVDRCFELQCCVVSAGQIVLEGHTNICGFRYTLYVIGLIFFISVIPKV